MPSRIGIQNLNVNELAVAYELAVSSLRTSQIITELRRRGASEEERRDISLAVIELRTPDNEFVVGDRVMFETLGSWLIGTVTDAKWVGGLLFVDIITETRKTFRVAGNQCWFYD